LRLGHLEQFLAHNVPDLVLVSAADKSYLGRGKGTDDAS
jgi:hypothetical protein